MTEKEFSELVTRLDGLEDRVTALQLQWGVWDPIPGKWHNPHPGQRPAEVRQAFLEKFLDVERNIGRKQADEIRVALVSAEEARRNAVERAMMAEAAIRDSCRDAEILRAERDTARVERDAANQRSESRIATTHLGLDSEQVSEALHLLEYTGWTWNGQRWVREYENLSDNLRRTRPEIDELIGRKQAEIDNLNRAFSSAMKRARSAETKLEELGWRTEPNEEGAAEWVHDQCSRCGRPSSQGCCAQGPSEQAVQTIDPGRSKDELRVALVSAEEARRNAVERAMMAEAAIRDSCRDAEILRAERDTARVERDAANQRSESWYKAYDQLKSQADSTEIEQRTVAECYRDLDEAIKERDATRVALEATRRAVVARDLELANLRQVMSRTTVVLRMTAEPDSEVSVVGAYFGDNGPERAMIFIDTMANSDTDHYYEFQTIDTLSKGEADR